MPGEDRRSIVGRCAVARSVVASARSSLSSCSSLLLLAGGVARADEQSDLEKVRAAYLAHQYDDAERRLRAMLDPMHGTLHDAPLVSQARMYLAAVLLAKAKREDAGAIFERLVLDDPQFEPDPLSFPTDVIDLFIDTRSRLRDRLNAQAQERARFEAQARAREGEKKRREVERVAMLEKLAAEETVTQVHSRWIALVPFGAGQFQNGKSALGWAFLGTGVGAPRRRRRSPSRSTSSICRTGPTPTGRATTSRRRSTSTARTPCFYANLAFVGAFAGVRHRRHRGRARLRAWSSR